MYRLSLILLQIAVLIGFYILLVLILIGYPWSWVIVAALAVANASRYRKRRLTTLGSACWAEEIDLARAGMLESATGLLLGRVVINRGLAHVIAKLMAGNGNPFRACQEFYRSLRHRPSAVVRLPQAIHTAVFSPSGQGKGVSGVIPFLLTTDESCVIIDFKGENAKLTAEHRRREFGHQVILLDPFHNVTNTPDSFNPLDFIQAESSFAIDECNDLAKALVIRTSEEKEPHWNDIAEFWIASMLATVVRYGEPGMRSLQTMRDFFCHPQRLDMAVKLMCESDSWNGMLARMGGQLSNLVDREKSSTLSTVSRHLRFLDTLAIAASTNSSSFDPDLLRRGKMSIYLTLPPEHMRAQSALLRMWIGSFLRAVVRGGLQEQNKVHFLLDEAASLGHLEAIEDAVDKYRGYGIRLQFYFQSLGQLKKCFPQGQDQTLLSNTSQVFFGVNDTTTAEFVSARLGEETIIVESGGRSAGTSWQRSTGQGQASSSYSNNSNDNWQQQARKLLKPEEVIALDPRIAITFTPGVPPICTYLMRYYEEPQLGKKPSPFSCVRDACRTLLASLLLCGLCIGIASLLTRLVIDASKHERQMIYSAAGN